MQLELVRDLYALHYAAVAKLEVGEAMYLIVFPVAMVMTAIAHDQFTIALALTLSVLARMDTALVKIVPTFAF